MDPYANEWLQFLARWLHVMAGIVWIGTSFYFVALDNHLRDDESWEIHGGGFYRVQKYVPAPPRLPDVLHWFKWEAYTTWLSGFALFVVLYYLDADTRLVDPAVADLSDGQAIGVSLAGIVLAWFVYDVLCRTVGRRSQVALAIVGTGLVALAAWIAGELLAPRAAYLQVGVMLGTIMVANVLLVIIPAHRKLVSAMEEKRVPDAAPLLEAKNRSVHNNYLTLPVLFTMLAGHFAFVFGADQAWLVFVVIAVLTALIRVFFNRWHAGKRVWWIPAVTVVAVIGLALWLQPEETSPATGRDVTFEQVAPVIAARCAPCHSGASAPLGIQFETREQIEARIDDIERQAVQTRAMPPGNQTGMTDEERALLASWIAGTR